jgi:hypothetical protein
MDQTEKIATSWVCVVRGWKEGDGPAAAWRFTAEDPHTGERCGFASLGALEAYLQTKLSSTDTPAGAGRIGPVQT